jgi:hypothetical protein
MVNKPEDYEYSSHRAYLGLESAGIVDADPVLRHFGARKDVARARYQQFVAAGIKHGHREEFYAADEGRILGTEEFIDATIHRIGEPKPQIRGSKNATTKGEFRPSRLIAAVEEICRVSSEEFCGRSKSAAAVTTKEMLILVGLQLGASRRMLSEITGISSSALSRRCDAVRLKVQENVESRDLATHIIKQYRSGND